MNERYIQILGIMLVLTGSIVIAFLYWTEPRSLAEVSTKGQVAIGTYSIDKEAFAQGISLFTKDDCAGARAAFARADPEQRDANTQFYVAYSYYRQGWGRIYNDDAFFTEGVKIIDHVIALDPNYRSTDETLAMRTPAELKNELEEGLKITPSDFNPMRLTRDRK
jgi:glutamine cyclotransferase